MSKFIPGICVFTLAAAGLYPQTVSTPPAQVIRTSAIVGLAEGQTAQLNALNPGVVPPAAGAVCTGLLTILDGQGVLLKSKTVSVPSGASHVHGCGQRGRPGADSRRAARNSRDGHGAAGPASGRSYASGNAAVQADRESGNLRHAERADTGDAGRSAPRSQSGSHHDPANTGASRAITRRFGQPCYPRWNEAADLLGYPRQEVRAGIADEG